MFEYEYSFETAAQPQAIWQLYVDVASWQEWDHDLEKMEMFGPFEVGTKGRMTVKQQPPMDVELVEVTPGQSFTDATEIPDAQITVLFEHHLTPLANGGTRITHRVSFTGPAAETAGPVFGPMITEDVPLTVQSLAEQALKVVKQA